MNAVLSSLPSPSINTLELGPLSLRLYGLSIALGVIAAVVISSRRWEARGGDPDDIGTIALWAVPAGVIGARAYHVATDWKTYQDDWGAAFNITNGGLGIPGGVLFGVLAGLIVVRVKKLPALDLLDVVAPAIPVAQAIGRLGNWFNQELFGRPTTLPWGLEIDPEHRPAGYEGFATFHPTFLYEALWNLSLAGLLVYVDKKKVLKRGELFAIYVMGYGLGRLWVEALRIDTASLVLGVRVNIWMSLLLILVPGAVLVLNRMRTSDGPVPAGAGGEPTDDPATGAGSGPDVDGDGGDVGGAGEAVDADGADGPEVPDDPEAAAEAEPAAGDAGNTG